MSISMKPWMLVHYSTPQMKDNLIWSFARGWAETKNLCMLILRFPSNKKNVLQKRYFFFLKNPFMLYLYSESFGTQYIQYTNFIAVGIEIFYPNPHINIFFFFFTKHLFWIQQFLVCWYKLLAYISCTPIFKESALGRFFHRVAMSVCVFLCLSLFMRFFSRPLIGPQVTWSDPGLSLVDPPLVHGLVQSIHRPRVEP